MRKHLFVVIDQLKPKMMFGKGRTVFPNIKFVATQVIAEKAQKFIVFIHLHYLELLFFPPYGN